VDTHNYVMANMTLSIPDELLARMKKFNEIKWSEVARRAIEQRTSDLEAIDRIASKSKITKKDVEEFDAKIKAAANKRFLNANHN
jgi:hypothetical protein